MFYYASKFAALLVLPSSAGLIAITVGLLLIAFSATRRKQGLWIASTGVIILMVAGFSPMSNWLIYPLEQRFANHPLPTATDPVHGIIILGGFEDGWVSAGRPSLAVNEAAERLTEAVRYAKRWPQAKIVFTGGVGGFLASGTDAAGPVGAFLADAGVKPERIVLEGQSRNTLENAIFTRRLVAPKSGDTWLLVTSAYHMPRAIGVFRTAGFNVVPAPVDYRTRDSRDLVRFFNRASAGLMRSDLALKEWIGLVAYRLTGRTAELFPGP